MHLLVGMPYVYTRTPMPKVAPGETYYDRLPDGRYERCVLQPTTDETPDRMAAARGGTGVFYRVVQPKDLTPEVIANDSNELIWDLEKPGFVYLTPE